MNKTEIALRLMESRPFLKPDEALNLADELLPKDGKIMDADKFMYRFADPVFGKRMQVWGTEESIDALVYHINQLKKPKVPD